MRTQICKNGGRTVLVRFTLSSVSNSGLSSYPLIHSPKSVNQLLSTTTPPLYPVHLRAQTSSLPCFAASPISDFAPSCYTSSDPTLSPSLCHSPPLHTLPRPSPPCWRRPASGRPRAAAAAVAVASRWPRRRRRYRVGADDAASVPRRYRRRRPGRSDCACGGGRQRC